MTPVVFLYATLILLSMSVAPLFMKTLSLSLSDAQVLFSISFIVMFFSLIFLLIRGEALETFEIIFTKKHIGVFILIVAFLLFLDTWPYVKALQAGADVSILLSYVRAGGTVCTALLGVYFLGEKLTSIQWLGISLCVVGIVLLLLFKHPQTPQ